MEFLLVVSLRCFCCVLAQIPSSLSLRTSAFPPNTCTRRQGQTGNQSLLANLRSSQDSHDPLPVCDLQKNKAHSAVTNRSAERKGLLFRLYVWQRRRKRGQKTKMGLSRRGDMAQRHGLRRQDSGKPSSLHQRVNRKCPISVYVVVQHLPTGLQLPSE